jgi:hypothetical protein
MKNLMIAFLGMLCTVVSVSSVNAAGLATSILNISNARLEVFKGGSWVTAQNGVDVSVAGLANSSSSTALTYTGSPFTFAQAPNLDSPLATIGPNVTNFASADTSGAGQLVNPGAPVVAGTVANVATTGNFTGSSLASSGAGGTFAALVSAPFRYIFNASYQLTVASSGLSSATAAIEYSANLNVGNSQTPFIPPALNISLTGNGATGLVVVGELISPSFGLDQGQTASFNITQISSARISAVPEPASFAVAGILGTIGFAARRLRRKK